MKKYSRAEYNFSKGLRYERKAGVENCCEVCGKKTNYGEVHHLLGAYLASQNPVLTPAIIKSIENELYCCRDCHAIQNEDQHTWDPIDIGHLAWALFDLDMMKVANAQRGTYKNKSLAIFPKRREKRRRH